MNTNSIEMEAADKYSLRGRVYHQIREDIINGHYKKNEELREAAIANELGISRTPVREALRQLELEGLVVIVPNKGAYVRGFTDKDIHDIYMIRSLLEGLCAKWAAENITEEQMRALEESVDLSEFHLQKGNVEQFIDQDSRFHELMYQASGSKILEDLLTDYHQYIKLVREASIAAKNRSGHTNIEHRNIMTAIKEKDGDRAEKLANQHIINSMRNIGDCKILIDKI
ncbi:MAG: GntR family transcriptional regulator [Lachnospiraceae bacterium]|nr:GntR family transcriptional regulator [Lachnospiraceae bacterium]